MLVEWWHWLSNWSFAHLKSFIRGRIKIKARVRVIAVSDVRFWPWHACQTRTLVAGDTHVFEVQ